MAKQLVGTRLQEASKLKIHDRLVAVNGQTLKAAELVQQVQTLDSPTLMIERPETWVGFNLHLHILKKEVFPQTVYCWGS